MSEAMWVRLIQPVQADLTEESARSLFRMTFCEENRQRMHELAVRKQAGELTAEERAELDDYGRVGRLLDLIHSRARLSLRGKCE